MNTVALKPRAILVLSALLGVVAGPVQAQQPKKKHPLEAAIRIAKDAHRNIGKIGDYQAELTKKEVVGKEMLTQKMRVKIRHDPFSVYLYFVAPNKGREVIYQKGRNEGKLLVHESGVTSVLGTMELTPDSYLAMRGNRYPITKIGVEHMTDVVIRQWQKEMEYGEVEVKYYNNARIGDLACRVVESTHPHPRKQFKFKTTRLWLDKKTNVPVRVEQFGFPKSAKDKPPMVEQYTYLKLRPNVGLTDRDFDKTNPRYSF